MGFDSIFFLLFIALAIPACRSARRGPLGGVVLAGLNLVFLAFFASSPAALLPLAGVLLLGFLAIRAVRVCRSGLLFWGLLVLLTVLFVWLKGYALVSFLPSPWQGAVTIGLSYSFFRVLQILIDARQDPESGKVSLLGYVQFVIFFPALISGPIQSWQSFANQLDDPGAAVRPDFDHLERFALGYFKVFVLGDVCWRLHGLVADRLPLEAGLFEPGHLLLFGVALALYTAFLYLNFSGYMDIVIPVAAALGFRLPENFDRPFAAENFILFWSRWHMTLSNWFRDYLFTPVSMALMRTKHGLRFRLAFGVAAYFATFFLMGVWHGTTWAFLFFGLALGLGVSLNKLYQVFMQAPPRKEAYRRLCANPAYRMACRAATFSWFACGLSTFWLDSGTLALAWTSSVRTLPLAFCVAALLHLGAYLPVRLATHIPFGRAGGATMQDLRIGLLLFVSSVVLMAGAAKGSVFVYEGF